MRDYQAQRNNPYWLQRSLYRRTLALIRDYDRMKEIHDDIPEQGKSVSDVDGMPHSGNLHDDVFSKVADMSVYWEDMKAVEEALNLLPEEYRNGVWNNIVKNERYPDDANPKTYRRYKQTFIWHVARNKGWI